jgi:tRNA pseudouridine38-40 synthase
MPRYRIDLEYDGRPFHGWQRQKNALTVQEIIENALEKIVQMRVQTFVCGRTDAGVHALQQVVHFDLEKELTPFRLCEALNYHVKPYPISILCSAIVDSNFNARFDAIQRQYRYIISTRYAPPTYRKGLIWHIKYPLNIQKMQEAAHYLLGQHDFTTFRAIQCQAKSPIRTIDFINIQQCEDEVHIHIGARSFLHHQVRSITGTLVHVGRGQWSAERVKFALFAKDRKECGAVAPSDGLYLEKVFY